MKRDGRFPYPQNDKRKLRVELKIAWRYLFAKKSHNAINIVSAVSAAGIAIATAALVCVLSVLNGFNVVLEKMFSQFDPDLRIVAEKGKAFSVATHAFTTVREMRDVAIFSEVVEEMSMITYKDHQTPAKVMGVDSLFRYLADIDSIITDGYYEVYDGAFDRCVLGRGLASQLGVNAHFVGAVRLYAPKRTGRVNMLRPDKALNKETCYMAGTFAVNQVEYDDQLALVNIAQARRLFQYPDDVVTSVELKVAESASLSKVKKQIRQTLGSDFLVQDRYEQQEEFFKIARTEKLLCTILLAFILVIAAFNCIGSLSMLMLEKKNDVSILRSLGATNTQVRRIFLNEGWLISILGAAIGLIIGLAICLSQQQFGWLKLGNGSDYILSAYPVAVMPLDLVIISIIVLTIGFLAAYYPTRRVES